MQTDHWGAKAHIHCQHGNSFVLSSTPWPTEQEQSSEEIADAGLHCLRSNKSPADFTRGRINHINLSLCQSMSFTIFFSKSRGWGMRSEWMSVWCLAACWDKPQHPDWGKHPSFGKHLRVDMDMSAKQASLLFWKIFPRQTISFGLHLSKKAGQISGPLQTWSVSWGCRHLSSKYLSSAERTGHYLCLCISPKKSILMTRWWCSWTGEQVRCHLFLSCCTVSEDPRTCSLCC